LVNTWAVSAPSRQRLPGAERRDLICEAAMAVFAERGYREASIAEIAREAGITAAVIYDHFPSKADLQVTLLEAQTEELLAFVGAAIAAGPEETAARFRVGVDAFFGFVEEHPYAWRMLFRDPPSDPAVGAAHARVHRRATEGIAAFLMASAPPALLGRPDFEQMAEMLAEMLKMAQNGLAVWWYEHREVPRSTLVERVVDFCWIGLERFSAGEG
jgi:AcrR family transcriptional regulator